MEKNRTDPEMCRWIDPVFISGYVLDSTHIPFGEVFSIFFMQHWGLPSVVLLLNMYAREFSNE
jgi:hypothetical protein